VLVFASSPLLIGEPRRGGAKVESDPPTGAGDLTVSLHGKVPHGCPSGREAAMG